ncbi:hypothetical protein [Psychroserpens damuponensis]|uniref:hypothetical protein n=1 Tax=Psychroserpens damuponensis TaxID=943936 RepID=UPI0005906A42|nr:hypothetical protein [Psychroserpens damuponensis]
MTLKNLPILFLFFGVINQTIWAQDTANTIENDTISYSEDNSQKVIEFGQKIESIIHESNSDLFVTNLNKDKFFDRVLSGYSKKDREDNYIKGFLEGMDNALKSFPGEIIADVENGAYYDFINYRYDLDSQTYYILFRLYSAETGMNYHDYRLVKTNGEIQFSDMYIYLTGEHFTSTIGRLMQYSVPKNSVVKQQVKNPEVKDLYKAFLYNKTGKYEKAYKIMDGFKSELAKEKFLLIFKTLIAAQIDEAKYLKSLEDLISAFPEDHTIALNKVDYYIYKEEYYEAIQVVNQLQNETEDDFLNFFKAGIAFEDKNYDLALNLYTYTIDNYPDFFEGQSGYLSTLVMMENYDETNNYLDRLLTEGYEKQDLIDYIEEEDEYGQNMLDGYSKSKNFAAWKKAK